jgi:hypothetical protein
MSRRACFFWLDMVNRNWGQMHKDQTVAAAESACPRAVLVYGDIDHRDTEDTEESQNMQDLRKA